MANEVVGIEIKANTGSLRTQIREATQEFVKLEQSGKASAEEIARAAQRVADLKDNFADANTVIDAFNPDQKFRAFSQSIQGVAGAFAAAQGALGLFGVESDNLQKQLLKVQSALALSEGLNTVLDSVQGFKNLALVIKTQVVAAFTTLKGALTATGIGAIAIAVGYLVGNWDRLTKALTTSFPIISKISDKIGSIVNSITDFIGITSEADRQYEKSNAVFLKRKQTIEDQVKVLEALGNKETEVYKLKKELVGEEIKDLENKKKTVAGLNKDEILQLQGKYNEIKVLDAAQKKYLREKAKEDAEKRKRLEDEAAEKEQERLKQIGETQFENYKKQVEEKNQLRFQDLQTEIDTLERSNEVKNNDYKQDIIRLELAKERLLEQRDIELESASLLEDSENKKLEIRKKYADEIFNLDQKITDSQKAQEEARYILKMQYADLGIMLGKVLQDAAGQNKDLAIAGILVEQGAAIAKITMGSLAAASKAGFLTPKGIAELAAGALGVTSAIIAAKKGIDDINKVNIPGSVSSSATSTSTPPIMPQFTEASTVNLSSDTMNKMNNVAMKAYVVESDISNSQQRIKRLENSATF